MKIIFDSDKSLGVHYIGFGTKRKVVRSELIQNIHPMIILDKNKNGRIVGIEILETK